VNKKIGKIKIVKCGFCQTEFDKKELKGHNMTIQGAKSILVCPYCNCILGVYYAG
jgi:hypothetical protein